MVAEWEIQFGDEKKEKNIYMQRQTQFDNVGKYCSKRQCMALLLIKFISEFLFSTYYLFVDEHNRFNDEVFSKKTIRIE